MTTKVITRAGKGSRLVRSEHDTNLLNLAGALPFNVRDYGATGRGGSVRAHWKSPLLGATYHTVYATVTASSRTVNLLQEAGGVPRKEYFVAANVGDPIEVMYGGSAGGEDLFTWIVAVDSSTQVTLAHPARATVSTADVRVARRAQPQVEDFAGAGAISAGSRTLTVTGASFTTRLHVGKYVKVVGAGSANLYTTIEAVTDADTVVLADAPAADLSHAQVIWGPDDRPAVVLAVADLIAAGGGRLYFPTGSYKLVPPAWDAIEGSVTGCIQVGSGSARLNLGALHIYGEGIGATRLVCRSPGDLNPTNDVTLVDWLGDGDTTYRGAAICVASQAVSGANGSYLGTFRLHDLEIDGGAYPGCTGSVAFSPTGTDFDGWDGSHKGVYLPVPAGLQVNHVSIERCWLHNFRAELIYHAGGNLEHYRLRDSKLGAANGNGSSCAMADGVIEGNYLYDFSNCGHEEVLTGPAKYLGNTYYDMRNGVALGQHPSVITLGDFPALTVIGNQLEKISAYGISARAGRCTISGNILTDVFNGISCETGELGLDSRYGLNITNNNIGAAFADGGTGINIDDTDGVIVAWVHGNSGMQHASGSDLATPAQVVLGRAGSRVYWGDNALQAPAMAITSGTDIASQGLAKVTLTMSGATTFTTWSGAYDGQLIAITATNGNSTIQHNSVIKTSSGSDLTLSANIPTFWRVHGTLLCQV
jgi:hypothetical protein